MPLNNDSSNQKTLASYQAKANKYISRTPREMGRVIQEWIDQLLLLLHTNSVVLEIGSAGGRDARYIESKGYRVERTDAVAGFVEQLQQDGYKARILNVLNGEIGGPYNVIFANAVFHHFTPEELKTVLIRLHPGLAKDGILAFSVKRGDGSKWSDEKIDAPRYFCYWQPDLLHSMVQNCGFALERINEVIDDFTGVQWLQVIARCSSTFKA